MPTLAEEYEIIKGLLETNPTWKNTDDLRQTVYPQIIISMLGITAFFLLAITVVKINTLKSVENREKFMYKTSYQATNFVVNMVLSILGSYFYLTTVENLHDATVQEKALGYDGIYLLSYIQLGYNLWAIPVGRFLVNESSMMLLHHVAVIACATTCSMTSVGFGYYTPFMFGVLEISSTPLSIMNAFKDNPWLIQKYPGFYSNIRLVFAVCFLFIRWYLFFPIMLDFLRLIGMAVILFQGSLIVKALLTVTWVGSAFVLFLQAFWGSIIVKGLMKGAVKKVD
mmetsp:Transcript_40/g.58  ORF Transcript_40/g.58 Transcript_40/m.58 type:complete len:283 (+) Transcript_40:112-960(+)|eukprot:CAMPEP_0194209402 /NCGR_PEP_ID=MMETSP0156-20130528/7542_1 /TAXON_ID=33649 /ORGANISM="Thalassionema nitzschioides, Strain L26-B" /LENGTH=282 /DNA_ID=CAMNT_0038936569 /DNA_START=88 /DNA_END=936 /DNA_ORIENTATION=+